MWAKLIVLVAKRNFLNLKYQRQNYDIISKKLPTSLQLALRCAYLCNTVSEIINKVANSGLITLNLEHFFPKDIVEFDLKQFLFMELILKEKDYRAALKEFDFAPYQGKTVALYCSTDAIIPHWAYMLAVTYIAPITDKIYFGSPSEIKMEVLIKNLRALDVQQYADKRMVIKGCGEEEMNTTAYVEITKALFPVAKSIMYGEPCSTVPIYKKPNI